jgi:hypothetical protein
MDADPFPSLKRLVDGEPVEKGASPVISMARIPDSPMKVRANLVK